MMIGDILVNLSPIEDRLCLISILGINQMDRRLKRGNRNQGSPGCFVIQRECSLYSFSGSPEKLLLHLP